MILGVEGSSTTHVRLDASSDLERWEPLDLLRGTAGVLEFTDGDDPPGARQRFYRAVGVDAQPRVTGWSADRIEPGARLAIFGELFARGQPRDHLVFIDGQPATVLRATGARLLVQVPGEARSGEVSLVTPDGIWQSSWLLTVTAAVRVDWALPPGMSADGFEALGAFGSATRLEDGSLAMETRVGKPQVLFATPRAAGSLVFFAAVSEGDGGPVVFGATSTAEALVFLHPRFHTQDPATASGYLAAIRGDARVAVLARVIATEWPVGGDPFTRPALVTAYREAVISVGGALASRAEAGASPTRSGAPGLHSSVAATWELDPSFVRFHSGAELRDRGGKPLSVGVSAVPANPVDWVVVAHEVDAEAAFPRGQEDLLRVYQRSLPLGLDPAVREGYPLRPGYEQRRFVGADLLSSNFHVISQILSRAGRWGKELLWGEAGPELFEFEARDAVYVIRAVGPAVLADSGGGPATEADFLKDNREGLGSARELALALNLLAGALDLLSGSFDLAEELGKLERTAVQEGLVALAVSTAKEAPKWRSLEDVLSAILDLSAEAANFIGTKAAEEGLESAAMKAAGSYGKAAGLAAGILTALDLAGTAGEVLERGSGFVRTTPLESTFVVVGDPFRLEIVGITPTGGAPGDLLAVVIRRARFDSLAHAGDKVFVTSTNSSDPFLAAVDVLGAPVDLSDGRQLLQVRLPSALAGRPDGPHRLHVHAQGRSGEIVFDLVGHPAIDSIQPVDGFAAVEGFLGQPFPGSAVRIRGVGFGPEDEILFGGSASTDKSGTTGDVIARVPAGAASGSVVVRRRVAANDVREGTGPHFTVLGAPVLLSSAPATGPVGTRLGLTLENLGAVDAALGVHAIVVVSGRPLAPARRGRVLEVAIPVDVPTGAIEVAVFTPAGTAATPFVVEPGRAPGAEVTVGSMLGCSGPTVTPVTLAAALALAAGTRPPVDDEDIRVSLRDGGIEAVEVDSGCAWEEGDFVHPDLGYYVEPGSVTPRPDMSSRWPVGAATADRIVVTEGTGELSGDFEFAGSYDTLHLDAVSGSLRLTGTNNTFTARSFRGTRLVIEGAHNVVRGTFELTEGVTIRGYQNDFNGEVRGSLTDGLVVQGDQNEITVFATENARDGVVIDGGRWNRVIATTGRNGGNGATLKSGASGNQLSFGSGRPFGEGVEPGTGNTGHGVLVAAGAKSNSIRGVSPVGGNGGDGVRLEGDGIEDTLLEILDAVGNGGNGFTIGPGVVGTLIPTIVARNNRGDGVRLVNVQATTARFIRSGFNGGDGISITGVNDGVTELGSLQMTGNGQAGLRLAGATRRLRLEGLIESGTIGLKVEGTGVASNVVHLDIRGSASHGAEIEGARRNQFRIQVRECGGHGVLARNTATNEFDLDADRNVGDGLRLQGSRGELVSGRFLRNRSGVVVAEGSRNNTLHALQSNANRAHGVHLTGAGTGGNSMVSAALGIAIAGEPDGNLGDGLRIDDGAAANLVGGPGQEVVVSGNAGVGLRVAGPATTGNRIVNAVLSSPAVGPRQPVGILVEDGAAETVIGGPEPGEAVLVAGNVDGIVVQTGAQGTSVLNCEVARQTSAGIRVLGASDNGIGGAGGPGVLPILAGPVGLLPPVTWANWVHANRTGIEIAGPDSRNNAVRGNTVTENETGVRIVDAVGTRLDENSIFANTGVGLDIHGARETRVQQNTITDNAGAGVRLAGGATRTETLDNRIQGNPVGVQVVGAATRRNRLSANTLSGNAARGIELAGGSNDGIQAPRIEAWSSGSVSGTTSAPDNSRVEVFADPIPGFDEGHRLLGAGRVSHGRFQVRLPRPVRPGEVGRLFGLNATVTDPMDNTSEFGGTIGAGGTFRLVYVSTRDGNADLYLAQGLFAEAIRLTRDPAPDTSPALSPDGTRIAFVSTRDGNAEIYLMTLAGTNPVVRLTHQSAMDADPAWSADGSRLAFVSDRDGRPQVYRMDADGSNVTRLTAGPWNDRSPRFSPDGSQLVLASDRSGDWDLWILDVDGSVARPVASHAAADSEPRWSPDGRRIAFVSDRDGDAEIYTVGPDGSDLRRVTEDPASDRNPDWSPESDGLLFSSNRDEGFEIYWISSAGGAPERFTLSGGDNSQPAASR